MKHILFTLLLFTGFTAAAQQRPVIERTRTDQVLSDRATWSKQFLMLPTGETPAIPAYVPDSLKDGALWNVPGEAGSLYRFNKIKDTWERVGGVVLDTMTTFNNYPLFKNENGNIAPATGMNYQYIPGFLDLLDFTTTKIQTTADVRMLSTIHAPNLALGTSVGNVAVDADGNFIKDTVTYASKWNAILNNQSGSPEHKKISLDDSIKTTGVVKASHADLDSLKIKTLLPDDSSTYYKFTRGRGGAAMTRLMFLYLTRTGVFPVDKPEIMFKSGGGAVAWNDPQNDSPSWNVLDHDYAGHKYSTYYFRGDMGKGYLGYQYAYDPVNGYNFSFAHNHRDVFQYDSLGNVEIVQPAGRFTAHGNAGYNSARGALGPFDYLYQQKADSTFVPYTGATQNIDLGAQSLQTTAPIISKKPSSILQSELYQDTVIVTGAGTHKLNIGAQDLHFTDGLTHDMHIRTRSILNSQDVFWPDSSGVIPVIAQTINQGGKLSSPSEDAVYNAFYPIKGTPTIATDVGAGTGATASVTTNGRQLHVTVTNGTSPAANSTALIITLANPLPYTPCPTLSIGGPVAAPAVLTTSSITSTGPTNITISSNNLVWLAGATYYLNISL